MAIKTIKDARKYCKLNGYTLKTAMGRGLKRGLIGLEYTEYTPMEGYYDIPELSIRGFDEDNLIIFLNQKETTNES